MAAQAQPALIPAVPANELHLWADSLEAEPRLLRFQGHGRLFSSDLRLLAESLSWAPDADWLTARGRVELAAPAWELKAESLTSRPGEGFISAQQLELKYKDLILKAERADMTGEVWRFEGVEVRLTDSPLTFRAGRVRLVPKAEQETLLLEDIELPGLSWRWPALSLNLTNLGAAHTEIRSPVSVFQPELGLVAGGLYLGFRSELWRDQTQRLYGRIGKDPLQGPLAELSHEWRPASDWLIHSQLGVSGLGLQAQAEGLWQTPLGPWLRGRARWRQPDLFFKEFWLPPLQPALEPASDLELWLADDWSQWPALGGLRTRWLAGARWPQRQAGLTGLALLPLYEDEDQSIEASLLLNALATPNPAGTAGGRLLYQRQLLSNLTLGGYLEQYLSSLGSSVFAQTERLSPWLGAYALWQPLPDLGLGLESALSLSSGRIALANGLISWHWKPFYFHLLLQALPAGAQLQTRFEL